MTIDELRQRLIEAGFGPLMRGALGITIGGDTGIWVHAGAYTVGIEHDRDTTEILLATTDEDAACCCLYKHVVQHRSWPVMFSRDTDEIARAEAVLAAAGISSHGNDIPAYSAPNDRVYRIWVAGQDLSRARELVGAC